MDQEVLRRVLQELPLLADVYNNRCGFKACQFNPKLTSIYGKMDVTLDFVLCLKSKRRLERDKGLSQLRNLLSSNSLSAEVLKQLQETFLSSLSSTSTTWEEKHGALMATILLLPVSADQWAVRVRKELPQLLQHKETRVGAAAGRLHRLNNCARQCFFFSTFRGVKFPLNFILCPPSIPIIFYQVTQTQNNGYNINAQHPPGVN